MVQLAINCLSEDKIMVISFDEYLINLIQNGILASNDAQKYKFDSGIILKIPVNSESISIYQIKRLKHSPQIVDYLLLNEEQRNIFANENNLKLDWCFINSSSDLSNFILLSDIQKSILIEKNCLNFSINN